MRGVGGGVRGHESVGGASDGVLGEGAWMGDFVPALSLARTACEGVMVFGLGLRSVRVARSGGYLSS